MLEWPAAECWHCVLCSRTFIGDGIRNFDLCFRVGIPSRFLASLIFASTLSGYFELFILGRICFLGCCGLLALRWLAGAFFGLGLQKILRCMYLAALQLALDPGHAALPASVEGLNLPCSVIHVPRSNMKSFEFQHQILERSEESLQKWCAVQQCRFQSRGLASCRLCCGHEKAHSGSVMSPRRSRLGPGTKVCWLRCLALMEAPLRQV